MPKEIWLPNSTAALGTLHRSFWEDLIYGTDPKSFRSRIPMEVISNTGCLVVHKHSAGLGKTSQMTPNGTSFCARAILWWNIFFEEYYIAFPYKASNKHNPTINTIWWTPGYQTLTANSSLWLYALQAKVKQCLYPGITTLALWSNTRKP